MRRLLELLSPSVFRFAIGFCRRREDAEDVAQEALAALARTVASFRGDSSLSTWAFTVARNACIRRRRREKSPVGRAASLDARGDSAAGEARAVPDEAPGPQEALERGELRRALEAAIRALPPGQRQVLLLRDVEGLSAREVGRVTHLGEVAVKSRLHRARLAVRAALAPLLDPDAPRPGRGCPQTARFLSRYLEGDIERSTCERLAEHVAGCAGCSAACDSLRAVVGACRRAGTGPLDPALRASIRRAILAVTREAPGSGPPPR